MTTDYTPLRDAYSALASRCDYAQDEDGAGFNKPDAGFGHRLAVLPVDLWTPSELRDAWKRLRKYRGQLASFGIDFGALPVPPEDGHGPRTVDFSKRVDILRGDGRASLSAEDRSERARLDAAAEAAKREELERAKRRIDLVANGFRVAFPYSAAMVAGLKAIPGRKIFDGASKTWTVGLDANVPRLAEFCREFGFTYGDGVLDRFAAGLTEALTNPTPAKPEKFVEVVDGAFEITFPYSAELVDALKRAVPGVRWVKTRGAWQVTPRFGSVEGLAKFIAARGFASSASALAVIDRIVAEHTARIDASAAESATLEEAGLVGKLPAELVPMPFQLAGVRYAVQAKRVIIGDAMGLGKTIQALLVALATNAFPLVIVCPSCVLWNWFKESKKWLRGKTVSVLEPGNDRAVYHADVLIVSYDNLTERAKKGEKRVIKRVKGQKPDVPLSRHARGILGERPRTVVFDEVHYLKNHKALRTMACERLAEPATYKLGLSGTAIVNRPSELLSILGILDRLNDLGGFWHFVKRYCGAHETRFGLDISGATNLDELNEKLRATCYLRREKRDVLKDLPDVLPPARVLFDLDNRAEYDRAEADVQSWIAERAAADESFLAELDAKGITGEARRDAIAKRATSAGERAAKAEHLVRIEALKLLAARGKLTQAIDWIGSFVEAEKLILFARHIEIQRALLQAFPTAAHILGEDDARTRQTNVDRFQTDPACRLIIVSLDAGGVGWTGTAASNVAFFELGWTPGIHDQARDRAHRIGQKNAVTPWYLLGRNTIEEEIEALVDAKRKVTDRALSGARVLGAEDPDADDRVSVLREVVAALRRGRSAA